MVTRCRGRIVSLWGCLINGFGVEDLLFGVALCSQITILPSAHKHRRFLLLQSAVPILLHSLLLANQTETKKTNNRSSHQRSTTNLNPQQGKNQICGSHNPVDVGSMGYRGNQKKEREREREEKRIGRPGPPIQPVHELVLGRREVRPSSQVKPEPGHKVHGPRHRLFALRDQQVPASVFGTAVNGVVEGEQLGGME
jgi:hypothetical protein